MNRTIEIKMEDVDEVINLGCISVAAVTGALSEDSTNDVRTGAYLSLQRYIAYVKRVIGENITEKKR